MKEYLFGKGKYVLLFVGIGLFTLFLLFFARDPNLIRVALFTHIEIKDKHQLYWNPAQPPTWFISEPSANFAQFSKEAVKVMATSKGELAKYRELMRYVSTIGPQQRLSTIIQSDSIFKIQEQLKQGYIGNCAHYSWLLMAHLRSLDVPARIVGTMWKYGYGGVGHAMVEVWVRSLQKWVLFDVYHNMMYQYQGEWLNLFELRDLVQTKEKLIQAKTTQQLKRKPKEGYLPYFRLFGENLIIDAANHYLINGYNNRFGFLSGLSPFFEKLPRKVRRFVENLLSDRDIRVQYIDERATKLHPVFFSLLFWSMFWLTLFCFFNFLVLLLCARFVNYPGLKAEA